MKDESIVSYILQNERNLQIGEAVGAAWPDARNKIVASFLDRLDTRLKRNLKGWKSERYGALFQNAYAGYFISKSGWDERYYVNFQFANYGESVVFGVGRDFERFGKRPFCANLLSAVAQIHPSACQQKWWWEARVPMRSPAADWRSAEVLWRVHKDQKFIEDVADQLVAVAKAVEPVIDRLLRKK